MLCRTGTLFREGASMTHDLFPLSIFYRVRVLCEDDESRFVIGPPASSRFTTA